MDLTNKPTLFNDIFPAGMRLQDKYRLAEKRWKDGDKWILLNNISTFAPFNQPDVPWDISDEEKIAIYNQEVSSVLSWLKAEILDKSAMFNYKTLDVLIRIASSKLYKCNVEHNTIAKFCDNMTRNLLHDYIYIINEDLPF